MIYIEQNASQDLEGSFRSGLRETPQNEDFRP